MEFVKNNFDKLLLTFLVLTFSLLAYRGFARGHVELAQFAVDNSKLFAGALLTLITGRLIQKASDSNSTQENKNAETPKL